MPPRDLRYKTGPAFLCALCDLCGEKVLMLRELKKFPVYAHIGAAILLWVTLREADELVRNGSAERISRRGFALRLTGHKFTGAAGQVRDLSCRMDERVMVANADGERRARGIVAGWAVNHAGLARG